MPNSSPAKRLTGCGDAILLLYSAAGQRTLSASIVEILQGTLDLMVLRILETMGEMHGYGIAMRLQQISEDLLQVNQGTLYPALLRLEQQGSIAAQWGTSENNRRAKYYSITRLGRKQLRAETANWEKMAAIIGRLLEPEF